MKCSNHLQTYAVLLLTIFSCVLFSLNTLTVFAYPQDKKPERIIYQAGTPSEMEVIKIYGTQDGPTIMLLGGIHGDEPGAYLSAESFSDVRLRRGNLIIVPRSNIAAIIRNTRAFTGDMNRKFDLKNTKDTDFQSVEILKDLMQQSDVLITLHDGSGFYRPQRESDLANPMRYGQSIITDTDQYETADGKIIELKETVDKVISSVNSDLNNKLHYFHHFNMNTAASNSPHSEHKLSATYYALTKVNIPAFCIETSKQLPNIYEKVFQHNLVINAFLKHYGVVIEYPTAITDKPILSYIIFRVNDNEAMVASPGQRLKISSGDRFEILEIGASNLNGVFVEIANGDRSNILRTPIIISQNTDIVIAKDTSRLGVLHIDVEEAKGSISKPVLIGNNTIKPLKPVIMGSLALIAETSRGNTANPSVPDTSKSEGLPATIEKTLNGKPTIEGFIVEVDGKRTTIKPNGNLVVVKGSKLKLVDIKTASGVLPSEVVMNLKGYIAPSDREKNIGQDKGATADTANDMMPAFSIGQKGIIYPLNAELGKTILASSNINIVPLELASVTIKINGQIKVLSKGSRTSIPVGSNFEVVKIALQNGLELQSPRYTIGGHPLPSNLPLTIKMRDIAVNFAVFSHNNLTGKITFLPSK